jgi:cytochrome P450
MDPLIVADIKLPSGMELTPFSESFKNDPYSALNLLRTHAPVFKDAELGRYIISRHDDVRSTLRSKTLLRDPRKANKDSFLGRIATVTDGTEPSMLFLDEPDHKRLRALVVKPFTAAAVEKWRPRTREVIQRTLNDLKSSEFDLMAEFCNPIPTVVIAEMLGVDSKMHDDFKKWSDIAVAGGINPLVTPEQKAAADAASESLNAYFRSAIQERRNNFGDDLISDMVRAEEGGQKLTEDEIVTQCNLLLIAGNVTTTDLIGNGVKALLDHPEQLKKLQQDPSLIVNLVEEVLRYESPVQFTGRIANETINLQGCPIQKGESMTTSLAAANRDPDIYPEPDVFDIKRQDTHHQAFGGGSHLCLGAHLARLEAQESIIALIDRFPNIAHSEKGFTHAANFGFRGMSSFWVTT